MRTLVEFIARMSVQQGIKRHAKSKQKTDPWRESRELPEVRLGDRT
jgi:hypothetical protein